MAYGSGRFNRVQHGLERCSAEGLVEVLGKSLEVDVPGVDIGQQGLERFFFDIAIADHDVDQAGFVDEAGRLDDEFIAQGRFVVGVGQADAAVGPVVPGQGQSLFRRQFPEGRFLLGNLPVLTEGAGEIAAPRAQGQDGGTGMEAIEGLLFNGIQGDGRALAVVQCLEALTVVIAGLAAAAMA